MPRQVSADDHSADLNVPFKFSSRPLSISSEPTLKLAKLPHVSSCFLIADGRLTLKDIIC